MEGELKKAMISKRTFLSMGFACLGREGNWERCPTGYLGVVRDGGQAGEIARLVNQARMAEYKKLAQQNGQWIRKP